MSPKATPRATPSQDGAGYLFVGQSKCQRRLPVRLGEYRGRGLLEDFAAEEHCRVLGHIRVGDASLGGIIQGLTDIWEVMEPEEMQSWLEYKMRPLVGRTWEGMDVEATFTPEEQRLIEAWERHLRHEFADRDAVATVGTMSDENYVNHVPVMTGGRGREEMLEFYGRHFIPKMPADTRITPVCRTVGQGRVVDEIIFSFTHDVEMDWMLPGLPPTGRRVEVPTVVVVQTDGDRIVCERIYWDQASVLVQLGLLAPSGLPVAGAETARKVLDPNLPSNELIRRAADA